MSQSSAARPGRPTVCIVTPAAPRSRLGNRVTALRWARLLRQLGCHVRVEQTWSGRPCDLLVALHAEKSFESLDRFHQRFPDVPTVVVATGTDLTSDQSEGATARTAFEIASRIVVLQPLAIEALAPGLRGKARVIVQSVAAPPPAAKPAADAFEVCVIGHLRPVKDPFRAAEAARLLPNDSRIRILHIGAALSDDMRARAEAEQKTNPRYRWLGELPRRSTLETLGRSRLLVLTSHAEGGANVISEAIAARIPVISSAISGSIGILGAGFPGYFPAGDTRALAALLRRVETDPSFEGVLKTWSEGLRPLVDPARERHRLAALLDELLPSSLWTPIDS